jgi:MFS family permease
VSEAAWFTTLRTDERRALLACTGGWVLDAMDVQMYSFVLPSIMALWHVSTARAGLLGTATLLASALGGWLAGALADRIGRVRTLQITILWFAVFCAICAVAQNFTQLFAARAIMGFGFGGEWAAGSVLLGEVIRPQWRGRAVGTMQSGWAIGWAIAALLYTGAVCLVPAARAGGGGVGRGGFNKWGGRPPR